MMFKTIVLASLLGAICCTSTADAQGLRDFLKKVTSPPSKSDEPSSETDATTFTRLAETKLSGLFSQHPYDGTPATQFPRVSIRILDWSKRDCWTSSATIWWDDQRSEVVEPHLVCPDRSLGAAIGGAQFIHAFVQQTALDHTGNVRGDGPRPPQLAVPFESPLPIDDAPLLNDFIQQWVSETGWRPGVPETQVWIADFGSAKPGAAQTETVRPSATAPVNATTLRASDGGCTANNFTEASFAKIQNGMSIDQVKSIIGCSYSPAITQRNPGSTMYAWMAPDQNGVLGSYMIMVWFDGTSLVSNKSGKGF